MNDHNSVHLADASLDLLAWIVIPAIEKTLSDVALVAGTYCVYSQNALYQKLLVSFIGKQRNSKTPPPPWL